MKKYLFFIILIIILIPLQAQEQQYAEADSISTVVVTDSAEADSISTAVVTDSLELTDNPEPVSIEELEQKLLQYIRNRKLVKEDLTVPALLYKENFHQASLSDPLLIFKKNNFSILPFKVKNLHILQSFEPLLLTRRNGSSINFQPENYDLQIPLTESFLALGDNNMNHAGIWFAKGNLLNVTGLNVEASYLGQEGEWLGVNETSRNFNVHISRNFSFGKLHFDASLIDQKIPAAKLVFPETDKTSYKEKFSDLDLTFLNNILDVGLRYEEWSIGDEKRLTRVLMLSKELNPGLHNIRLQYEFQRQSQADELEDLNLFSLQHKSNLRGSVFSNQIRYAGDKDLYLQSTLLLKIIHQFHLKGEYNKIELLKTGNPVQQDKTGFGLGFFKDRNFVELIAGERIESFPYTFGQELLESEIKHNYLEFNSLLNLNPGNVNLLIKNFLHYNLDHEIEQMDENSFIPAWQSNLETEIKLDLKHSNAISLGMIHTYYSDFYDITEQKKVFAGNFIDLFITLQITELFKLKLEAVNITDEKYFPYVITRDSDSENYSYGTHVNFSVNWTFIN